MQPMLYLNSFTNPMFHVRPLSNPVVSSPRIISTKFRWYFWFSSTFFSLEVNPDKTPSCCVSIERDISSTLNKQQTTKKKTDFHSPKFGMIWDDSVLFKRTLSPISSTQSTRSTSPRSLTQRSWKCKKAAEPRSYGKLPKHCFSVG